MKPRAPYIDERTRLMQLALDWDIPDWIVCPTHGGYDPNAYYNRKEMLEMLDDNGRINCPLCLAEIVGVTE